MIKVAQVETARGIGSGDGSGACAAVLAVPFLGYVAVGAVGQLPEDGRWELSWSVLLVAF